MVGFRFLNDARCWIMHIKDPVVGELLPRSKTDFCRHFEKRDRAWTGCCPALHVHRTEWDCWQNQLGLIPLNSKHDHLQRCSVSGSELAVLLLGVRFLCTVAVNLLPLKFLTYAAVLLSRVELLFVFCVIEFDMRSWRSCGRKDWPWLQLPKGQGTEEREWVGMHSQSGDQCATRPTWLLCVVQHWGDSKEVVQSMYGLSKRCDTVLSWNWIAEWIGLCGKSVTICFVFLNTRRGQFFPVHLPISCPFPSISLSRFQSHEQHMDRKSCMYQVWWRRRDWCYKDQVQMSRDLYRALVCHLAADSTSQDRSALKKFAHCHS